MNKLFVLAACFLIGSASAELVCSVHDGDTIKLCSGQSVRVAGIDAPELKQPYGPASRDYLKRLVLNKDVQLSCAGRSYNRVVCSVSQGKVDIEREMVKHGWAYDSAKYSHLKYKPDEDIAHKNHLGVWKAGEQVKPWDFRHPKR